MQSNEVLPSSSPLTSYSLFRGNLIVSDDQERTERLWVSRNNTTIEYRDLSSVKPVTKESTKYGYIEGITVGLGTLTPY